MPEATFKGVRIKSECGAGRPLGQDGPPGRLWGTEMQRFFTWINLGTRAFTRSPITNLERYYF